LSLSMVRCVRKNIAVITDQETLEKKGLRTFLLENLSSSPLSVFAVSDPILNQRLQMTSLLSNELYKT